MKSILATVVIILFGIYLACNPPNGNTKATNIIRNNTFMHSTNADALDYLITSRVLTMEEILILVSNRYTIVSNNTFLARQEPPYPRVISQEWQVVLFDGRNTRGPSKVFYRHMEAMEFAKSKGWAHARIHRTDRVLIYER